MTRRPLYIGCSGFRVSEVVLAVFVGWLIRDGELFCLLSEDLLELFSRKTLSCALTLHRDLCSSMEHTVELQVRALPLQEYQHRKLGSPLTIRGSKPARWQGCAYFLEACQYFGSCFISITSSHIVNKQCLPAWTSSGPGLRPP